MFSGEKRTSDVWNISETGTKEEILLRCCIFGNYRIRCFFHQSPVTWKSELCFLFRKAVKLHGVHLLGVEGKEYDVKLEVLSQSIENKFHAQKNIHSMAGFDVMLLQPIEVQANIIVHLKVTIRGHRSPPMFKETQNPTVETNGITVNFIKLSDIKSSLTNIGVQDDLFNEIIFSEI